MNQIYPLAGNEWSLVVGGTRCRCSSERRHVLKLVTWLSDSINTSGLVSSGTNQASSATVPIFFRLRPRRLCALTLATWKIQTHLRISQTSNATAPRCFPTGWLIARSVPRLPRRETRSTEGKRLKTGKVASEMERTPALFSFRRHCVFFFRVLPQTISYIFSHSYSIESITKDTMASHILGVLACSLM